MISALIRNVSIFQVCVDSDSDIHMRHQQEKRRRFLELLSSLYAFTDVWHLYCNIRESQLEQLKPCNGDVVDINALREVVSTHMLMMKEDIELILLFDKEQREVTAHNDLCDVYCNNMAAHVQHFLRNYRLLANGDSRIPGLVDVTLMFETMSKDFSVSNIRTFARLFGLLDEWDACVHRLANQSSAREPGNQLVCDENESDTSTNGPYKPPWNWLQAFVSYTSILSKSIPLYVQCVLTITELNSPVAFQSSRLCVMQRDLHGGKDTMPLQVRVLLDSWEMLVIFLMGRKATSTL